MRGRPVGESGISGTASGQQWSTLAQRGGQAQGGTHGATAYSPAGLLLASLHKAREIAHLHLQQREVPQDLDVVLVVSQSTACVHVGVWAMHAARKFLPVQPRVASSGHAAFDSI